MTNDGLSPIECLCCGGPHIESQCAWGGPGLNPMTMTRDRFIEWLDMAVARSVPMNIKEFTRPQLVSHIFDRLFESMRAVEMVPEEKS